MTIIYLAKQAVGGLFATAAFLARSITNHTVTSPSDLNIFGKPVSKQIAFDGYSSNIEAFICATSVKTKLYCDQPHYPINTSKEVTVPIGLPRTVFTFKNKGSEAGEAKMMEAAKDMGIEKRIVGKGVVYTIEKPTIEFLGKLRPAVPDACLNVTDYSQYGATLQFYWLTQVVDLFLATNTYSYRPSHFEEEEPKADGQHPSSVVEYYGSMLWGSGCSKEIARKKRKLASGWEDRTLVDPSQEAGYDSGVKMSSAVFVAKPSPLPSKTSWGAPAECPNSKGIHFPYFEGLSHSDTAYMRRLVHKRFFRNLGSSAIDPKEAYKQFRTTIGPAATTPQGRIMNHILFGIDLALDTQTQLYLLFDGKHYYGFNLLGGYFSIWSDGWREPAEEAELQNIMARYRTHDGSMKELIKLFRAPGCVKAEGIKIKNSIRSSQEICSVLGAIDQEKSAPEVIMRIQEMVGNLVFDGVYRNLSAKMLEEAVDELLGNEDVLEELQVYVPKDKAVWKLLASPYYVPIASFGARSFSLIDRGGKATEVQLVASKFKAKLGKEDKADKVKDGLPFFEKPIGECLSDWARLVETGKARINFQERAVGSRGFLVRGEGLTSIIAIFEAALSDGKIGIGPQKIDRGKGKQRDVEMTEITTVDDLF